MMELGDPDEYIKAIGHVREHLEGSEAGTLLRFVVEQNITHWRLAGISDLEIGGIMMANVGPDRASQGALLSELSLIGRPDERR